MVGHEVKRKARPSNAEIGRSPVRPQLQDMVAVFSALSRTQGGGQGATTGVAGDGSVRDSAPEMARPIVRS